MSSHISLLSGAEKLTFLTYQNIRKKSVVGSEIISRIVAFSFLSLAAAFDLLIHSLLVVPTFVYAIGKSLIQMKADFILPWQHIQRVRNAIAPLLLGSIFGLLHPFAGFALCEPTDKHAVLGMLSSNTNQRFVTPCSPIHSLSIVEELAHRHRYVKKEGIKKEIFSPQHLQAIRSAKKFESSLEALQAQEFIQKITNLTLGVMAKIKLGIEHSRLSHGCQQALTRLSGLLIPILTLVDVLMTLLVQVIFLVIGAIRVLTGRGPIYTEVTTNPLMHLSFLMHNTLKFIGNLIGTLIWFVSPLAGFKTSLIGPNYFFKMQMSRLLASIRSKMIEAKENSCFVLPVVFQDGICSAFSVPTHSMHKTYLTIEKKHGLINLYWIDRPHIECREGLKISDAFNQVKEMLNERFPFMDFDKMMDYPIKSNKPKFLDYTIFTSIGHQGNDTNCVVSNLFGMLEVMDKIKGVHSDISKLRYSCVRKSLTKSYNFYKNDFSPLTGDSLKTTWNQIESSPEAPI